MTSNIPAYSTYFPSKWTVEDGDDSATALPNINATVKSSSSPSSSPSPSPSPVPLTAVPLTAANPTQTQSKYLTHFPPSWALPPSSTRTSSLRPFDSRSLSTSADSTPTLQSTRRLVQRSTTAFNLGPQIALGKQLNQGQSFPVQEKDEDYLDNFRETLRERLVQSAMRKGLRRKETEWANKSWYAGMPQVPDLTPLQKMQNLGAANGDQMDEEDHDCEASGTEDADDEFYGTGYGDVPHQAPHVANAYSTRGSASVASH